MGTNFSGDWVPTNSEELADDLKEQLVYAGVGDRYAGLVLTFVTTNSGSAEQARRFNSSVLPLIPMFETSAERAFFEKEGTGGAWLTSGADEEKGKVPNGFRVDIYLLNDGEEHSERLEELTNLEKRPGWCG